MTTVTTHNSRDDDNNNNNNNNNSDNERGSTDHHHRQNVHLGWATMRYGNHHHGSMIGTYNEDDANALQLHDVGSILKDFDTREEDQNQH